MQHNSINLNILRNRECLCVPKNSPATEADTPSQNQFYTFESCFTEEFSNMKTLFFTEVYNFKEELSQTLSPQIANSFKSDSLTGILQEHIVFLREEP